MIVVVVVVCVVVVVAVVSVIFLSLSLPSCGDVYCINYAYDNTLFFL